MLGRFAESSGTAARRTATSDPSIGNAPGVMLAPSMTPIVPSAEGVVHGRVDMDRVVAAGRVRNLQRQVAMGVVEHKSTTACGGRPASD